MSFLLAERGFDVVGIDSSSMAIHEVREDAQGRHFRGSFRAQRANAKRLPFPDASFDGVVSYNALHHVDDPRRAITEMFRVCRPGGLVVVSELSPSWRRRLEVSPDHGFLRRVRRWLATHSGDVRAVEGEHNRAFICRPKNGETGANRRDTGHVRAR